jgi:acetyl esterase/lipase
VLVVGSGTANAAKSPNEGTMVAWPGRAKAWFKMIKCLAFSFMLAATAISGLPGPSQHRLGDLIKVGLDDAPHVPGTTAPPAPVTPDNAATAGDQAPCSGKVTFTRSVKYGGDSLNVLDAASSQTGSGARRPVLVFVAGNSFAGDDNAAAASPLVDQALCFAASNGLVAFHVSYRVAPAATWPAGARDVAAAISWVHENADLFGGNAQEIIPVGYGTGAFHVASFLAHKEYQEKDDYIAGAVLVSGIYHPTTDSGEGARAYFGSDTSTYDSRSAIPGLTAIDEPIVLAWSSADAAGFIAQGEKLKNMLCAAGHCPRTSVLSKPSSPASVFDLDGASADLHERLRQLISQIDARGMP